MSLDFATELTQRLLGFYFLMSSAETLTLIFRGRLKYVWSLQNLESDLLSGLPLPSNLIKTLFSEQGLKGIVFIQLLASLTSLFFMSPWPIALLFLTHLLLCIRFRGSFNGGSDMMAFVVLSGLLLESYHPSWGLIYISIHTLYSYFKAGLSKIIQSDWRSGRALVRFMRISPGLSLPLSWVVIAFELGAIFLLFQPQLIPYYFGLSVGFHLFVWWTFGLNRFFWVWMSAWPSVFFCGILGQN